MAVPVSITLVVPTFRRPESLRRLLVSLREQALADFETLVVDNDCDPGVRAMVEGVAGEVPCRLRYVCEPERGLHNARHAGARAARGEVLVYTDDDATFYPQWLAAYARAFTEHPELAAAGGPVRPAFEGEPPDWLLDDMADRPAYPWLSVMDLGEEYLQGGELFFYGVNMAVRREVLFRLGGFNPDSVGGVRVGDGETGLQRAITAAGLPIGYVPDAGVTHHIPPGRTTLAYYRRRRAFDGSHMLYLHVRRGKLPPSRLAMLRHCVGLVLREWRLWLAAWRVGGRTDPASLDLAGRAAMGRGRLAYAFRLVWDARLRELVSRSRWLDDSGH